MAIEVQGKRQVNIMGLLMGVVIVGSIFAGAYFLLFQRPELIDVVFPGLDNVEPLSNISFEPERVFESVTFKALRQYGSDITPPVGGRANPFLP